MAVPSALNYLILQPQQEEKPKQRQTLTAVLQCLSSKITRTYGFAYVDIHKPCVISY